jgi:hypothetical protein
VLVKVKLNNPRMFQDASRFIVKNAPRYMGQAAVEAAELYILDQPGVKKYPPATDANKPGRVRVVTFGNGKTVAFRRSYYVRGKGTMIPVRGGKWRQVRNSQRYGTNFVVRRIPYGATIGNRATYAPYLTGAGKQSAAMAKIGWRRLYDVAHSNMPQITNTFQAWADKLLKDSMK